jgi:hypothetical protein
MQREISENLKSITIGQVLEYRKQRQETKTMGEFKALGREIRDRHGLTDREAIALLHLEIDIQV